MTTPDFDRPMEQFPTPQHESSATLLLIQRLLNSTHCFSHSKMIFSCQKQSFICIKRTGRTTCGQKKCSNHIKNKKKHYLKQQRNADKWYFKGIVAWCKQNLNFEAKLHWAMKLTVVKAIGVDLRIGDPEKCRAHCHIPATTICTVYLYTSAAL